MTCEIAVANRMGIALASTFLLAIAGPLHAFDLERLARKGYGVIETTQIDGEFDGCEYDKAYRLMNGLVFVCRTYQYSYGYLPEVLIMQHVRTGDLKVLINEDEYDGDLYRQ